jgi:hypothetical protein
MSNWFDQEIDYPQYTGNFDKVEGNKRPGYPTSDLSSPHTYAGLAWEEHERRGVRDNAVNAMLGIILTKIPACDGPDGRRGIRFFGRFEKRWKSSVR